MLKSCFENVRAKKPLVHNITNYVTVNDCANILLACGASPIMADDPCDAGEITALCGALNINIGTLNSRTIPAMLKSGKIANKLGHAVVLDPVGAGASKKRTKTAKKLLSRVKFSVIKGNISEIKTLALGFGNTKGVDAADSDTVDNNNLDAAISLARSFSKKTGAVVVITGKTDIVSSESKTYIISNGVSMMADITGSGCMLSSLIAAFVCANEQNPLVAAAAAVCALGICGEKAFEKCREQASGGSSFRNNLIDAVYNLTPNALEEGAKYEVR